MREREDSLRKQREFCDRGGKICWVVDTDIVQLYLNPKANSRYADIFPIEGPSDVPGLVALAALLADFIFSTRFQIGAQPNESLNCTSKNKLLLEPHTDELDDAIHAIARKVSANVPKARAAVAGGLEKLIKALKDAIDSGKEGKLSQNEYVARVLGEIEDHLKLILPDGPLHELRRAHELLKVRQVISYQADDESLHSLVTDSEFNQQVHRRADTWFDRLRSYVEESGHSLEDAEPFDEKRPNKIDRVFRDAEVLAKLELLNRREIETGTRYVLITGTGHLHNLIGELYEKNRLLAVHLIHPQSFLGNSRLFEVNGLKEQEKHDSDGHDARWKRMTQAVNLIGPRIDESLPETQALIRSLIAEWRGVQRMALPYLLPVQAVDKSLREVAALIFQGKSLEAIETQLYIALSEFFVVTAELGLLAHHEKAPSAYKRKPPPLRMAFYPNAERFVRELVHRNIWNDDGVAKIETIASLIAGVRKEQIAPNAVAQSRNFNYPLLLCLAARFAALDDWHAARVLASHAKAVAKITEHSLAFVTGREAALLESYSRRLEARNKDELESARTALKDFREYVAREEAEWQNVDLRATQEEKRKLHDFNPESEFPLHLLRADVDDLFIDFSEAMFIAFGTDDAFDKLTQRLLENGSALMNMIERSADYLVRLNRLPLFDLIDKSTRNETVATIRSFLQSQLELCALQCSIFMIAADPSLASAAAYKRWGDEEVLINVYKHNTVIGKLASLVGRCIWGDGQATIAAIKELTELHDGDLLPYDKTRHKYLVELATSLAK
jgi:hypothetical protein